MLRLESDEKRPLIAISHFNQEKVNITIHIMKKQKQQSVTKELTNQKIHEITQMLMAESENPCS